MARPVSVQITEIIKSKPYKENVYYDLKTVGYKGEEGTFTMLVRGQQNYSPTVGDVVAGWPSKNDSSTFNLSQAYDGNTRKIKLSDNGKYAVEVKDQYWPGVTNTGAPTRGNTSSSQGSSGGGGGSRSNGSTDKDGFKNAPYASQLEGKWVWQGLTRDEIQTKNRELRLQGNMSNACQVMAACIQAGTPGSFSDRMEEAYQVALKYAALAGNEHTSDERKINDSLTSDTGDEQLASAFD